MRLHFKEAPKEWRKTTLIGLIGPTAIVSILKYRGVIGWTFLEIALTVVALVAVAVCVQPRWFRGHYRLTTRIGFYTAQVLGRLILALFFIFIMTPFGWILRLCGKDFLQLKSSPPRETYWQTSRKDGSIDKMY